MSFVARRRDRPSESIASIRLLDKTGSPINPSTEETLSNIKDVIKSWDATKTLKFASVTVSTSPTQITTTTTLVNVLLIQNNSNVDVNLGDLTSQPIRIPSNGSFSLVLPAGFKIDLSALRLVASTQVTVGVMYA